MAELRTASTEGQLTLEQFSERLDAAVKARTKGGISGITYDTLLPRQYQPCQGQIGPQGYGLRRYWARTIGPCTRYRAAVDLRQAQTVSGGVTVSAFALLGEVRILVPRDADIELDGIAVCCEKSVRYSPGDAGVEALRVRVHSYALRGDVVVVDDDSLQVPGTSRGCC